MHRANILSAASSLVLMCLMGGSADAQLVVNGDFESGAATFTQYPGYTQANNPSNPAEIPNWPGGGNRGLNGDATCCDPGPFAPASGSPNGAFAFLQMTDAFIAQSISGFTIGDVYEVSYLDAKRNDNQLVPSLTASVNTTTPTTNVTVPSTADFTARSFQFTATSTTHTLSFRNTSGAGDITVDVDNVSITPIPEPASIALLAMSGLVLVGRRRPRPSVNNSPQA